MAAPAKNSPDAFAKRRSFFHLRHLLEATEVSPQPLAEPLRIEVGKVGIYEPLPLHGYPLAQLTGQLFLRGEAGEGGFAELDSAGEPGGSCMERKMRQLVGGKKMQV